MGSDISGPVACMERIRPEISACNAGTLNYLKVRRNGGWAWPPMIFDNAIPKIQRFLDAMHATGSKPEFESLSVKNSILKSIIY